MSVPPTTELDARAKQQMGLFALGLCGLVAWLIDLTAVYAVSTHECEAPRYSWLLTALGVACTGLAAAYSVRVHQRAQDPQHKFQAELALMLNALALLLTLGFAAPLLALRPCE